MVVLNEKHLERFELLLTKPRTVHQLAKLGRIPERTVYRWLQILEDRGKRLMRLGTKRPVRYQIL